MVYELTPQHVVDRMQVVFVSTNQPKMGRKNMKVTKESPTGRNLEFQKKGGGKKITRAQFVKEIKAGKHPEYYSRKINGLETPVSMPDESEGNNLG